MGTSPLHFDLGDKLTRAPNYIVSYTPTTLEMKVLQGLHAAGEAWTMDGSKNGVSEGAFCRRCLNYVFPPLSSSDPLLSPPSETVNSMGSIGRSRRKGGMAANSGVRAGRRVKWLSTQ